MFLGGSGAFVWSCARWNAAYFACDGAFCARLGVACVAAQTAVCKNQNREIEPAFRNFGRFSGPRES